MEDPMMTNGDEAYYDDDDDGLLSASSDERTAALAVVARYPSFCLGFFRGFYDFFHDFYCGIHFTNSFSRAPPGTWEINVSTRFSNRKECANEQLRNQAMKNHLI